MAKTWDEVLTDRTTYPDDMIMSLADGTEVPLSDLRAGYLKDADYRRKTSDLARQREEFEKTATDRAQALADAEARLRQMAEQLQTRQPNATKDEVQEQLESNPIAKRLFDKIAALEQAMPNIAKAMTVLDQRQKDSQIAYLAEQHRRVIHHLKEQDPELDVEGLTKFAQERYIPRLDDAYHVMNREKLLEKARKEAKEEGQKLGYEKAKKDLAVPAMLPGRRHVTPAADAPKTLDEAFDRAAQDPEIMGLLTGMA